jgi:CRP-like cAMP-binding protein
MASDTDLDLDAEFRQLAAWADVSKEALAELAASATQRRVHAGTALVEQGVPSQALVVMLRGAAKAVRTESPDREIVVVLDVMRAPCVVADVSILDGQPASASVVALRSSHIATVERRLFLRSAGAHPTLGRALLLRAAQEIRAHVRRIDEIVGGPVDERIKHLLDSLAEQHGTPLGQGRFIAIPLRRRDLACMVNATTETVSRLLARFEREGLARSTRDGIWWRVGRPAAAAGPPPSEPGIAPPSAPSSHPAHSHPASGAPGGGPRG